MSQVRDLLQGLTKVRPVLWWGFWVSSVVFIGISIGKRWPEIFPGASILGEYISTIATAYLGGFVFWFIVDHWEKAQSNTHLKKFVIADLYWIFNRTYHICNTYDEVHKYCPDLPKKHLLDSTIAEIAQKLQYLYLVERHHDNEKDFPFRWAVAAWKIQIQQFKGEVDHLIANFRDFDLILTRNIEVIHHSLPSEATIENLIEYKKTEELLQNLGFPITAEKARENVDASIKTNIWGFADQAVNFCQAIIALISFYKTLIDENTDREYRDISLITHRDKPSAAER